MNNINSVDEALDALEPVTTNTKNNLNNGIYILDNVKNTLYSSDCSKKYAFIISNMLHENGIGREFKIIGVYNDVVKWKQGETLYSNDYVDIKLEEEKYNAGPYR